MDFSALYLAQAAELKNYAFLGVGGSATVSGSFVALHGYTTGTSFTATVPQANGTNEPLRFADLYGSALPGDAVGFVGVVAGNSVYVSLNPNSTSDLKTNYARYSKIDPSTMVMLGEMAQGTTPSQAILAAGENHVGEVGQKLANPSANFTRPNDTTPYTIGDLVANSASAGSVSAMSWTLTRVAAGSAVIRRVRARKTSTSVTTASFRVHLFAAAPLTVTNGDNGAFSVSGTADYLGAFDVTYDRSFTDGAFGAGVPVTGSEHGIKLASGSTIYGLVEARSAYTPIALEVFTFELEVYQN